MYLILMYQQCFRCFSQNSLEEIKVETNETWEIAEVNRVEIKNAVEETTFFFYCLALIYFKNTSYFIAQRLLFISSGDLMEILKYFLF